MKTKMKNKKSMLFGLKLKMLRHQKDLKQDECADQVGCTLRSWSRWESGESYPLPIYRPKILEIFPEFIKIR